MCMNIQKVHGHALPHQTNGTQSFFLLLCIRLNVLAQIGAETEKQRHKIYKDSYFRAACREIELGEGAFEREMVLLFTPLIDLLSRCIAAGPPITSTCRDVRVIIPLEQQITVKEEAVSQLLLPPISDKITYNGWSCCTRGFTHYWKLPFSFLTAGTTSPCMSTTTIVHLCILWATIIVLMFVTVH